jgi:ribosomal protein S18 acetylase RimI-like enzyme
VQFACVPAGPGDLERVLELMRAYYAFDRLAFEEPAARRAVSELLTDSNLGRVFFVDVDGAVAGYAVLALGFSIEFHGRDAFVDEIYLREEYRGRGLGRRVLAFLEDTCRSLGVRSLHLEVERHNTAAQAVYRRVGFVDHDRYLMTKRIAAEEGFEGPRVQVRLGRVNP